MVVIVREECPPKYPKHSGLEIIGQFAQILPDLFGCLEIPSAVFVFFPGRSTFFWF